jgi:hypothetical protein
MFAVRHLLLLEYSRTNFFNYNYIGVVSLNSIYFGDSGCRNLRGSYALILLIKNFILMRHPEKQDLTGVTVNKFETQLAYWLDSFDGHLEFIPNAQQLLHDSLLSLDEQIYNDKEKKTIKAFLNSALSLTFLLKDNPTDLQKFINYKTQN